MVEKYIPKDGFYVAIEGTDGAGSTTTIQRFIIPGLTRRGLQYGIKKRIHGTSFGLDVVATREPGGTEQGEAIRNALLYDKDRDLTAEQELELFTEQRKILSDLVVVPALAMGKLVVSERSYGSTYAYQGNAGGVDKELIIAKTRDAISPRMFKPDAAVLINVSPEEAIRREEAAGKVRDKIESRDNKYKKDIYEGYLELAEKFDFQIVNGEWPKQVVGHAVLNSIIDQIGKEKFLDYVEERKALQQ